MAGNPTVGDVLLRQLITIYGIRSVRDAQQLQKALRRVLKSPANCRRLEELLVEWYADPRG